MQIDLPTFDAAVGARIAQTNAEGRELCGRFLALAESDGAGAS